MDKQVRKFAKNALFLVFPLIRHEKALLGPLNQHDPFNRSSRAYPRSFAQNRFEHPHPPSIHGLTQTENRKKSSIFSFFLICPKKKPQPTFQTNMIHLIGHQDLTQEVFFKIGSNVYIHHQSMGEKSQKMILDF